MVTNYPICAFGFSLDVLQFQIGTITQLFTYFFSSQVDNTFDFSEELKLKLFQTATGHSITTADSQPSISFGNMSAPSSQSNRIFTRMPQSEPSRMPDSQPSRMPNSQPERISGTMWNSQPSRISVAMWNSQQTTIQSHSQPTRIIPNCMSASQESSIPSNMSAVELQKTFSSSSICFSQLSCELSNTYPCEISCINNSSDKKFDENINTNELIETKSDSQIMEEFLQGQDI